MDEIILKSIIECLKDFECKVIYIFGSYAIGKVNEESDIDIAFLSDKKIEKYDIFIKAQEISSKVNREIDLIDLKDSTTVFQNQVVRNGVVILDKEPIEREKFEIVVLKKYMELNELRKELLDDYSENLEEFIRSRRN
ncbi:type VII toxin-antitoxin system MntA family adenylyltransferase antitoxin [Cetobacterium sp.]|uniref:type VII toxin-antitoxin system MntA family adenylyltransferase antitoxin n=1 Tax=Cetobacterium sp. TaxID=2071632 RepID=UPI003AEF7EB6